MDGGEKKRIRPPDLYQEEHERWTIHVKCVNNNGVEVGKLKFAKEVFEKLGNKCVSLNKISRDTMRLDCSSKDAANALVKQQPFADKKCFSPFYAKYCVGVMRDMDASMSEAEVNDLCGGKFSSVYRMMRFDKATNKRVPTNSVKVTMECDELPECITVYGMKCRLYLFEQRVKICFKCHRFGHFDNNCKTETIKCGNCGSFCAGMCERAMQCSSCGSGEHKSLQKKKKKLSKTEINNNISLEIIKNVNEIKRQNILIEKTKLKKIKGKM